MLTTKTKSLSFALIGLLGALLILYGLFTQQGSAQSIFFFLGSTLLLVTAIFFKIIFFIAAEIIFLAGQGTIFFGIGPVSKLTLPALLCIQLLLYYFVIGKLYDFYLLIGIIGIALLTIGFAYPENYCILLGNIGIGVYAFRMVIQGKLIALIWAILNVILAISTGYMILFKHIGALLW